jgi:hypothetical protein
MSTWPAHGGAEVGKQLGAWRHLRNAWNGVEDMKYSSTLPHPGADRDAMLAKLRFLTLEARTRSLQAQSEMAYYDWLGVELAARRISPQGAESILQDAYGIEDAIAAEAPSS